MKKQEKEIHKCPLTKEVILIVDDIQETLHLLREYLSIYFDVLHASNVKQAMFFCSQVAVDYVLTDLNLELSDEKSGFDLIKELKGIGYKGKIIVMSGYLYNLSEKEQEDLMLADKVFRKPFSIDDLRFWIYMNRGTFLDT